MSKFYNWLNEAKTSQTEDLHEIFFALSILGKISKDNSFGSVNSIDEILNFIEKNKSKLGKKNETVNTLKEYIEGELDPKQKSLLKDAHKAGKSAIKEIIDGYNIKINDVVSVERVFGAGESGTKVIADDKVVVQIKSGKDTISISLKYGAGQFNNLSVPFIIKKLYGIEIKGILDAVYKTSYGKRAIDDTLRYYISKINENNPDIEDKIDNNITFDKFKRLSMPRRKVYRKLYSNLDNKIKDEYLNKKIKIHEAIDSFLDDNKTPIPSQEDYIELLSYLLRSEKDTSYLYVAKGGKKTLFMPSEDALRNHEFDIKVKKSKKTGASYKRDVDIYVDGKKIIGVDLNFRWSQGQFMGDYSQKGSKLEFDKNFDW